MKFYRITYEASTDRGLLEFSRFFSADGIQEAKRKCQSMIEKLIASDGIPRRLLWVEEEG